MAIVDEAASLIAAARQKQVRIARLPITCRPRSVTEAHAIQDAVANKLGAAIGGYKATAPASDQTRNQNGACATATADESWSITEGVRALIFDTTIYASPCTIPSREMPQCGVEGEIAFRFLCDLPPRAAPYTREEIAAVTDAYPAIEVVSSRFASPEKMTFPESLADCVSNGGFVFGSRRADWQRLHLAELKVMLIVNGEAVVDQTGGHPTGDPFGIVVALVEMMQTTTGVSAGQFVTCGSFTGLRYFKPGDVCEVRFNAGAIQRTSSRSMSQPTKNRLAGMAAFGRAKRTLVDASRVPSSPLSFRSSSQNRFHQLSFCENEVEEHRNAGDTSEVRMRQQAPASRQLRNWAEHAYEIGFGVAQGRREWPKA